MLGPGRLLLAGAFALLVLVAGLGALETAPPLWWDEGWTLSVARNWIERGHYGQLLDGTPRGPGLAASLPVVGPVALSFRLLGIGIWQGRLVGVVLTLIALGLMWHLAERLYGRRVAAATLLVLLLLTRPHPILMGRQVLGEMPAVFYLLGAYTCFLHGLRGGLRGRRHAAWLVLAAMLLWGVALRTKAQAWPFWAASLVLPLAVALWRGWWRPARLLAAGLGGGWAAAWVLRSAEAQLLAGGAVPEEPLIGLYDVTAVVLNPAGRWAALTGLADFAPLTLLGVGHGVWAAVRRWRQPPDPAREIVSLALLGLAVSWLLWFGFLAQAWARYMFPALYFGSLFAAAWLSELASGAAPHPARRPTPPSGSAGRRWLPVARLTGLALAAVLVAVTASRTVRAAYLYGAHAGEGRDVLRMAYVLNARLPPDALVESYQAELFFLLNRRYHYPPDQVHVELNRRLFLNQTVSIDYDPLARNPDYLVTGDLTRRWGLYDQVLASGAFREVATIGPYALYARVR